MRYLSKITRRVNLALQVLINGLEPVSQRKEIPPISTEEVEEIKAIFPLEKFFIFGHARSGTTILARLIRLHPEIHCNWQAHFFTRPPLLKRLVEDEDVGRWLSRRSNRWNHGKDLSPLVLRAVADTILEKDARKEGARVVGDKSPNGLLNGEAVRLLHNVYPDAHLIFIVRDGRDTVLSHRFQTFIDAPQHLGQEDLRIRNTFAKDSVPFFKKEKSVFTRTGLRKEAEAWVKNITETDKFGRELFGTSYLSLRYKDLIDEPRTSVEGIWEFLGVEKEFAGVDEAIDSEMSVNLDEQWQNEKAKEIAKSLRKGKTGTWQDLFTPRDKEIFKEIAGEALITWGYETDLDW